jgi:hypothetical protein
MCIVWVYSRWTVDPRQASSLLLRDFVPNPAFDLVDDSVQDAVFTLIAIKRREDAGIRRSDPVPQRN